MHQYIRQLQLIYVSDATVSNASKTTTTNTSSTTTTPSSTTTTPSSTTTTTTTTTTTGGRAIVEVSVFGRCKDVQAIFQRLFDFSQQQTDKVHDSTSESIWMTQVFGVLEKTGIAWNHVDAMVNVSHCFRLKHATKIPKVMIVSSAALASGWSKSIIQKLFSPSNADSSNSYLIVVEEDAAETNLDLDEPSRGDGRVWLWKQNRFVNVDGSNELVETLTGHIHKQAASTSVSQMHLDMEHEILSKRLQKMRTLELNEFGQQLVKSGGNMSEITEMIDYLEKRSILLLDRNVLSLIDRDNTDGLRNNEKWSNVKLMLDPLWFYETANTVVDGIIQQQKERERAIVPCARHKGFYSVSDVRTVVRGCMPQASVEEQQEFLNICHSQGLVIDMNSPGFDTDDVAYNTYVKSVNTDTSVSNCRCSYFIPATLICEVMPPLSGRIPSLALRTPGIYCTEIPSFVFYDLVSTLAKRFPLAAKCSRYIVRLNPEPSHVLQLEYPEDGTHVKVTMFVTSEDAVSSGTVCSTVKELIRSRVEELGVIYPLVKTLKLQFAAVLDSIGAGNTMTDFVDINGRDLERSSQFFSVGNQSFRPASDFLLWYGGLQKVCPFLSCFASMFPH